MIKIRTFLFWVIVACLVGGSLKGSFEVDVNGLGWRNDSRIERLLNDILDTGRSSKITLDAAAVEDALLVLRGELSRRGFLYPEIQYSIHSGDNLLRKSEWDFESPIIETTWTRADRLSIDIKKGVRAYVNKVSFDGLTVIPEKEARSYFVPTGGLVITRSERAYSPSKLESGIRMMQQRMAQLGYLEAQVTTETQPEMQPDGSVDLLLEVTDGPVYEWGRTIIEDGSAEGVDKLEEPPSSGEQFSIESLQDWIASVRRQYLVAGYPDVKTTVHQDKIRGPNNRKVTVNVKLSVRPGPRVRLGSIEFSGVENTNERFLRRQTQLEPGSWLNRPAIQAAQFRLGQMGIFGRVYTEYSDNPANTIVPERNVRFVVSERERKSLSVLLGYGSYEQIRVGAEARALNLLGRAHSVNLRLRQSMRSSAGLLYYTIPRPVPWLTSAQMRLQGLVREEVSFDREEALLAIGVERNFLGGSVRTTAEYRYELLQSKGFESTAESGDTNTAAGSLNLGFSWDTRDQIVFPKAGASLQGVLELASTALGSEANYQRLIIRSSYHHSMDNDWLRWHFGLEGGILSRFGSDPFEFPINKRFFPGGENSIRGYTEGEASPLDSEGIEIGAEAYVLSHMELEASIVDTLALVIFVDGLWATPYLDEGSESYTLSSVGIGLRYSTPFGPLRLEYGHNVNPRPGDPDGALHLSIGFPF